MYNKIYIIGGVFILNILNLNDKIYGPKNLKQGEYANFMIESIEQKKMSNMNFNDYDNNTSNFNKINKEIKF